MHIIFENKTQRNVDIQPLKRYIGIAEKKLLSRLRSYCPKGSRTKDLALNVYFVTDNEIRAINREHRGKDSATDVISFSYVEDRDFIPHIAGEPVVAGEIFLSLQTIARQAKEKALEPGNELIYMLIHGFLHVFGYDHNTDKEEHEMESASYSILGKKYPRKEEFGF